MDIAFTGGSDRQRQLVREAVAAVSGRHLNLDGFLHTWNIVFLDPGAIDTTPHDRFQTYMVTQADGTTHIRNDMPFPGQGPFAGVRFFQESVIHELGHHLLGNDPGEGYIGSEKQAAIAALFNTTPSTWNPQNKTWFDKPVEGIAETFKDCFLAGSRREYFNRTNEKLQISQYPEFRRQWRNSTAEPQLVDYPHEGVTYPTLHIVDALGDYPYPYTMLGDLDPLASRRQRLLDMGTSGIYNGANSNFGIGFGDLRYERDANGIYGYPIHWFADHDLSWTFTVQEGWFPPLLPHTGPFLSYSVTVQSHNFSGMWERTYEQEFPGGTIVEINAGTGECWALHGDAAAWGPPTVDVLFHQFIAAGSEDPLQFFLSYVQTDNGGIFPDYDEVARVATELAAAIPLLAFNDPGMSPGEASPIPTGIITPADIQAGRLAHRTTIGGGGT